MGEELGVFEDRAAGRAAHEGANGEIGGFAGAKVAASYGNDTSVDLGADFFLPAGVDGRNIGKDGSAEVGGSEIGGAGLCKDLVDDGIGCEFWVAGKYATVHPFEFVNDGTHEGISLKISILHTSAFKEVSQVDLNLLPDYSNIMMSVLSPHNRTADRCLLLGLFLGRICEGKNLSLVDGDSVSISSP